MANQWLEMPNIPVTSPDAVQVQSDHNALLQQQGALVTQDLQNRELDRQLKQHKNISAAISQGFASDQRHANDPQQAAQNGARGGLGVTDPVQLAPPPPVPVMDGMAGAPINNAIPQQPAPTAPASAPDGAAALPSRPMTVITKDTDPLHPLVQPHQMIGMPDPNIVAAELARLGSGEVIPEVLHGFTSMATERVKLATDQHKLTQDKYTDATAHILAASSSPQVMDMIDNYESQGAVSPIEAQNMRDLATVPENATAQEREDAHVRLAHYLSSASDVVNQEQTAFENNTKAYVAQTTALSEQHKAKIDEKNYDLARSTVNINQAEKLGHIDYVDTPEGKRALPNNMYAGANFLPADNRASGFALPPNPNGAPPGAQMMPSGALPPGAQKIPGGGGAALPPNAGKPMSTIDHAGKGTGAPIAPIGFFGKMIDNALARLAPDAKATGFRTIERNKEVDGMDDSYHLGDNARDVTPAKGETLQHLLERVSPLKQQGFRVFIDRNTHVHIEPGLTLATPYTKANIAQLLMATNNPIYTAQFAPKPNGQPTGPLAGALTAARAPNARGAPVPVPNASGISANGVPAMGAIIPGSKPAAMTPQESADQARFVFQQALYNMSTSVKQAMAKGYIRSEKNSNIANAALAPYDNSYIAPYLTHSAQVMQAKADINNYSFDAMKAYSQITSSGGSATSSSGGVQARNMPELNRITEAIGSLSQGGTGEGILRAIDVYTRALGLGSVDKLQAPAPRKSRGATTTSTTRVTPRHTVSNFGDRPILGGFSK